MTEAETTQEERNDAAETPGMMGSEFVIRLLRDLARAEARAAVLAGEHDAWARTIRACNDKISVLEFEQAEYRRGQREALIRAEAAEKALAELQAKYDPLVEWAHTIDTEARGSQS